MDTTQYFFRTVVFGSEGDKVYLIDIENPAAKMEPLEAWLGVVLALADGQHTIAQLLDHLRAQYPAQPPENLVDTITSVLERLQTEGAVKLANEAIQLPYYLAEPVQRLDVEKAKRLMLDDGYLRS